MGWFWNVEILNSQVVGCIKLKTKQKVLKKKNFFFEGCSRFIYHVFYSCVRSHVLQKTCSHFKTFYENNNSIVKTYMVYIYIYMYVFVWSLKSTFVLFAGTGVTAGSLPIEYWLTIYVVRSKGFPRFGRIDNILPEMTFISSLSRLIVIIQTVIILQCTRSYLEDLLEAMLYTHYICTILCVHKCLERFNRIT